MALEKFPVLAPGHILRKIESYFVYDIRRDELYELDEEAFNFLRKCDGRNSFSDLSVNDETNETIRSMLDEGIILIKDGDNFREIKIPHSPLPSLRYLLLNITDKCNLACRHCYFGNKENSEMDNEIFENTVSQFEAMGGLKIMISGGEPLLHSGFWEFMEILPSYELRVVVLSNGTLIDKKAARKLSRYVHEVQVSIDGIHSHDLLRGKGSYARSMKGISNLIESGVPVSIATMIHRFNVNEFQEMEKLFSGSGTISWSVDVPCVTGALAENKEFVLDVNEAAKYLKYGFGAGSHESTGDYTCGSHICAISPDGSVSKCGFFRDETYGNSNDLYSAWEELCRKTLFTLDQLDCHDCTMIRDCKGGCRFRAKQFRGIRAPDPLMCHANGILRYI
ncbi:Coenzyme PQQ synthesis protein E [uncultured archaeon]|nr:Coenzyme PQQ synthesis protein E [uncultured archaeon]